MDALTWEVWWCVCLVTLFEGSARELMGRFIFAFLVIHLSYSRREMASGICKDLCRKAVRNMVIVEQVLWRQGCDGLQDGKER